MLSLTSSRLTAARWLFIDFMKSPEMIERTIKNKAIATSNSTNVYPFFDLKLISILLLIRARPGIRAGAKRAA